MRRALIVGGVLVLGVVAVALRFGDVVGPGSGGDRASPGNATRPAETTAAISPSRPVPSPGVVALPPVNTPVAQLLEPLQAAAARGDSPAACRLAMEIIRCRRWRLKVESIETMKREQPDLAPEWRQRAENRMREIERETDRERPVCEGVPVSTPAPWRLLLEAARRGHVPSMLRFTEDEVIRHNRPEWDFEALAAYREHAYAFLLRAAESGEPAAVARLSMEMNMPGVGTRAIPFDPVRAYAWMRVFAGTAEARLAPAMNEMAAAFRERLSPADVERAEALSATLVSPEALKRLRSAPLERPGPEADFGCR